MDTSPVFNSGKAVSHRIFFALFILSFIVSTGFIVTLKRPDLVPWIGDCKSNGYSSNHYLAYCHSRYFGDYEHYALLNEKIPVAISNFKKAEVLFLGNSRAQYVFSTDTVKDAMAASGWSYYVLGFGMGGTSKIPLSIIKKHNLQPSVIVINADPFFTHRKKPVVEKAIESDGASRFAFMVKTKQQEIQSKVCAGDYSQSLKNVFCKGTAETIFRDITTGTWDTRFYRSENSIPVSNLDEQGKDLTDVYAAAEEFLASVSTPNACIILTVTPRTETNTVYARLVAEKFELGLYIPEVAGLSTIDDSHLNLDSAKRWSEAFMNAALGRIQQCVIDNADFKTEMPVTDASTLLKSELLTTDIY